MGDQWLQDAQKELTERSAELTERFAHFKELHHQILKKARLYHNFGTSVHLTIIILGAVSAAQATVKDQIGANRGSAILLFSVLAILMSIGVGLESFFKWSKKSGALCSLAAMCEASIYNWHDQWHRVAFEYAAQPNHSIRKMLKLADEDLKAMNGKMIHIENRLAQLGVTLKFSFLSPEDIFRVPFGPERTEPSSDRNGRQVKGQAILNTSTEVVTLLVRERRN
jgi:hypothetical protein